MTAAAAGTSTGAAVGVLWTCCAGYCVVKIEVVFLGKLQAALFGVFIS